MGIFTQLSVFSTFFYTIITAILQRSYSITLNPWQQFVSVQVSPQQFHANDHQREKNKFLTFKIIKRALVSSSWWQSRWSTGNKKIECTLHTSALGRKVVFTASLWESTNLSSLYKTLHCVNHIQARSTIVHFRPCVYGTLSSTLGSLKPGFH